MYSRTSWCASVHRTDWISAQRNVSQHHLCYWLLDTTRWSDIQDKRHDQSLHRQHDRDAWSGHLLCCGAGWVQYTKIIVDSRLNFDLRCDWLEIGLWLDNTTADTSTHGSTKFIWRTATCWEDDCHLEYSPIEILKKTYLNLRIRFARPKTVFSYIG